MAMTMEDYRNQVLNDLLDYAREMHEYNPAMTAEQIMDEAWTADSVTGNGSGSYTFNTWEAQQNLSELIWGEELLEMYKEFGYDRSDIQKFYEVTGRE